MREVLLLRDFREDKRISMELYADTLANSLRGIEPQSINVHDFTPVVPSWLKSKNGMRIARYYSYPCQLKYKNASLFHIMDQAYGHLTHFINPKKTIVTVHDLMPLLRWKGKIQGIKPARLPLLALLSFLSLKKARHLIADSENTKNDLVNILGCDSGHISVIYLGVDKICKPFDIQKKKILRTKWFNDDYSKNRILITGSQFYKNHETALKTMVHLGETWLKKIQLVKTGNPTPEWLNMVRFYGLEHNVINLGVVQREELPEIYNAVDLLFFPSVYEGFGWPPLESMACGTPVVASNAGSLPEVMGEIETISSPYDIDFFASKIKEILSNIEYREKIILQGVQNAKRFDWNQTAKDVLNVYNAVQMKDY